MLIEVQWTRDTSTFPVGDNRTRVIQLDVSMDLLDLGLSDHACALERDWPSKLSGVGATERQLAILDRCRGCGLKKYAKRLDMRVFESGPRE